MGKRGRDIMYKHGQEVVAEFEKLDVTTRVSEVTPLAKMLIGDYLSGKYDKVAVAYTDYYSAVRQEPRIKELLPIGGRDKDLGVDTHDTAQPLPAPKLEFLFEPSPDVVLEQMLERLIELQLYQALLESNASEHSARMLAMRNASDAAKDLMDDLNLTFNQARQAGITREIAEISARRAALE